MYNIIERKWSSTYNSPADDDDDDDDELESVIPGELVGAVLLTVIKQPNQINYIRWTN